jgi:4-methoxybenzoate monooxygenase (O-demethylating)
LLRDETFTREEIALIVESLFSGGFDTTALTMTTGMWLLATHPEEMARARRDPEAMARITDEVLRMGGSIPMTIRVAAQQLDIEGYALPKDSVIGVALAAANRDPEKYPDPERFDLTRPPFQTMAFAYGAHACLGQWTARIEIAEIFKALLERAQTIQMIGEPLFRDRQSVRGVEEIHLRVA